MRSRWLLPAALLAACGRGDVVPAPGTSPADTLLPVNGTELFVHREGAGEPMIVIHGGPLLDHGYLAEPLRPLGERLALVFYDQRLSGRSAPRVDSASVRLATFVEDVDAIRAAFGFERVHVLGHSWGGLIAMEYASAHPDRVRSLILVSPMPPTTRMWQQAERLLAASVAPEDTAGMGALRASDGVATGDPDAIEQLLRLSFRSQFHEPAGAGELDFHIDADYGERSRQFGLLLPDLGGYDVLEGLRTVEVPVLVMFGASEIGIEPAISALRTAMPHAQVVRVPQAGHFPFMESPEYFLAIARSFLGKVNHW